MSAFAPVVVAADRRPIADAIPQEATIAYFARPYNAVNAGDEATDARAANPATTIATILAFLNAGGLIPDEGQIFADIATALPLLGAHEHALVLLDASSRVVRRDSAVPGAPEEKSLRLKHLEAFILLRTDGANQVVLEHVNRIVGRYTNRDDAKLEKLDANGVRYQRLIDSRMPDWAVWEWGEVGEFYALCFGKGSFSKVASAYRGDSKSLSKDGWYARKSAELVTDKTLAHWFIGFDRLKKRLGEISEVRLERVLAELEATDITRDMWVVGLHGRALSWTRCYEKGGDNVVRRYSEPAAYSNEQLELVPNAARHYAILNIPSRWLIENVPQAWVAAGSQQRIDEWKRIWNGLESKTGMDLSANLTDHLGDQIIMFDYPVHPLEIPFAMTIAIEIKDERQVRAALDAVIAAWSQYLKEMGARNSSNKLARVNVIHAEDGVWYLQAGILGPAIKVTGKYIVISWSPEALRQALKAMKMEPTTTTAQESAPPATDSTSRTTAGLKQE